MRPPAPGSEREPEQFRFATLHRAAAWLVVALWLVVSGLVSWTQIHDRDLGFHIAWGRLILQKFDSVRALTLGQDPSSLVYAYSYWFYQVVVAALFDAGGPIAVVSLRVGLVIGTLAVGCGIAKKLGAPRWTVAASLCLAILIAHERFVGRTDLVSHLLRVA